MKLARTASALGLVLSFASPLLAQTPGAIEALDGADPVLLVQGKDVFGKADLKVVRGRYTYLFSSPETRAAFEREPEKYEIQLDGLCARMGKGAMGNPSDFRSMRAGSTFLGRTIATSVSRRRRRSTFRRPLPRCRPGRRQHEKDVLL
jgi:YHS domain-containing protein